MAATLGLAFLGAHEAHAFRILRCNDDPVKWDEPFGMMQNLCSVPSGSSQLNAYLNAIARYRGIGGMDDMVSHFDAWPASHCTVEHGDELNDFALVDQEVIDGRLGRTLTVRSCDEIVETDILIANLDTQDFDDPSEAFAVGTIPSKPNSKGQFAVLHEFGHAHGLSLGAEGLPDNHTTGFSIMRATVQAPLSGGLNIPHARLMPDDAAGGRFLYPSGFSETNLMVSAQRLSGSSIVNNAAFGTINRCRGDSVTYDWTTGNRGTSTVVSNQRFFLSSSSTAHNQTGVTLATWVGATVTAQAVASPSITATIPCGTTPGLYFVYHEADSNNAVAENAEVDNATHNAMTVQVQSCGCQ